MLNLNLRNGGNMIAFMINLSLGIIGLTLDSKLSKFMAGWCLGIAFVLLSGYFGWINDSTLIFMGLKGE